MLSDAWQRFLQREMTAISGAVKEAAREAIGEDLSESELDMLFAETSAEEIGRYARRKRIDLIVVGRHGESDVDHLLMGSVSRKLVDAGPCPVMVIPPD